MKASARRVVKEIVVRCPVCGQPQVFVQGAISISGQLRFVCNSPTCKGRNRFINEACLKEIVDKSSQLRQNT